MPKQDYDLQQNEQQNINTKTWQDSDVSQSDSDDAVQTNKNQGYTENIPKMTAEEQAALSEKRNSPEFQQGLKKMLPQTDKSDTDQTNKKSPGDLNAMIQQWQKEIPKVGAEEVNPTNIPNTIKASIENFSGISLDDVRVNYNSSKPAEVNAMAYTQGNDIYLGPGQEQHLAHELAHIVQQNKGIVKPTTEVNGVPVNDDKSLEAEADKMGANALKDKPKDKEKDNLKDSTQGRNVIQRKAWEKVSDTKEKWDEILLGLTWYRNDDGTLYFEVTNDIAIPAEEKEEILSMAGKSLQLEEWRTRGWYYQSYEDDMQVEESAAEREYSTLIRELFTEAKMPIPKIEYTEIQGVSSAYYAPETHKIVINNKDSMTSTELWDNIAFEAGNAVNKKLFEEAGKMQGRSTATPMQYGLQIGQAEFKTMMMYITLIEKVAAKGITLPTRAQKALTAYQENQENFESYFLGSAHNAEAESGKGTLSTVELYAYEGVENLNTHQCKSKFSDIIRKSGYNLTSAPAQPFRNKIESVWESAPTENKPYVYIELVKEAIKEFPDAAAKLEALQLTPACQKVAKELKK